MARVPGRCRNADILGRSLSHFSYMRIRCGGDSLHRAIHRLDAWMDVTVQFSDFLFDLCSVYTLGFQADRDRVGYVHCPSTIDGSSFIGA
jgi:hypothetical protein